jgi:molecular chaperone DnaK (HSP70)
MQGEEEDPDMCTEIGRVLLHAPSQMAAGTPIEVTFRFNEGGLLKVNVKETTGGTQTDAEIERSGLLSAAQEQEAAQHVRIAEVTG